MSPIEQIRQVIEPYFERYEKLFESTLGTPSDPTINAISQHVFSMRGKQLRPMMVLLSAQLCQGINQKTLESAVALELIHTASLIHDDVVDTSMLRRGQESVNARWGNKIAVLIGDYYLSRAMQILAQLRNTSIMNIALEMSRSLATGEIQEMHHEGSMWISEQQYMDIITHKTASLFAACGEIAAVSAGASTRQQTALRRFCELFGICFQIKDDILDYSDADTLGKPTMNDIRDKKATLPLIVSLQRATKEETMHIRQLIEEGVDTAGEQEVKSFVLRYDGLRYAQQKMTEIKAQATEILNSVFRQSVTSQALEQLLTYATGRIY